MKTVRESSISGLFYPGDKNQLERDLISYLSQPDQPSSARPPKFIVVPHAGYVYSGRIAGLGYSEVRPDMYDRVIILGPSHRHYFQGIVQANHDAWKTPLGEVEIQRLSHPDIITKSEYHANEHCLEIQVPFIQYLLPRAHISPLLLSGPLTNAKKISAILSEFDTESTLWVISSDFSHVGPNFGYSPQDRGFKNGEEIDRAAIDYITEHDIKGFQLFIQNYEATICGALPILVALHLIGSIGYHPLKFKAYDCSGNQTGDINSVGYAALLC